MFTFLRKKNTFLTHPSLLQPKLSKSLSLAGSTVQRAQRMLNVIMLVSYFTCVLNSYTKEKSEKSDFSSLLHAVYRGLFQQAKINCLNFRKINSYY